MEIIKEKAVSFTGHRPEKIPGYDGKKNLIFSTIMSMLYYQIQKSIEDGFEYFISGAAKGIDLWAANYVLEFRRKYPDIKLICAVPFKKHDESFKSSDLLLLNNTLNAADEVIYTSEEYSKDCYRRRNYFMVDNSSRLIAVVNQYNSGTGQTINYANKKGLDVHIIDIGQITSITPPKPTIQDSGMIYLD